MKEKVVVSAVNLVNGGPLTILQKCMEALSFYAITHNVEVIALIHKKDLCDYPNIAYIEIPWAKKSWINRLFFEYIYTKKISKRIKPKLWMSLHDITPNVEADIRVVYCHNPTPFYHPKIKDAKFNYKEFIFSLFYRYLYRINIHKNDFVIVQQNWLKDAFIKMFTLKKDKVIVSRPIEKIEKRVFIDRRKKNDFIFLFPAFPRTFKNFEVICDACAILEKKGFEDYKVLLTLSGTENSYAKYLYQRYKHLKTVSFCGLLPKERVYLLYEETDCLIFPSKLETWGLPISEFAIFKRPMLVADLPYAHETAAGAEKVCFFNPYNPKELAERMEEIVKNNDSSLSSVPIAKSDFMSITSWEGLFDKLLKK